MANAIFTTEDLRPMGEVQIDGHDEGLALEALGHHLKETLPSSLVDKQ